MANARKPAADKQPSTQQRTQRRYAPRGGAAHAGNSDDPPVIFGLHAVAFALANANRPINGLYLTENAEHRLAQSLTERAVAVTRVTPRDLDRRLGGDTVHQGALAEVAPLPEVALDDLIVRCAETGPIVALDQVTDPHNVGAVLRSAAVFGAAGLVMTRRHSPPLHGVLAKAASGALELVPICLVQNLARALDTLGAAKIVRFGLDGAADMTLDAAPLTGPCALVLGAEGKGLRRSTQAGCDQLVRIAAQGPIASLNVSNAAAISLHLAALRRRDTVERLTG